MLDILMWLADVFYLLGSSVWQVCTMEAGVYFQPDIYGVTYLNAVGPFSGMEWNFAFNNFGPLSSVVGDAVSTISSWLSVPASTPMIAYIIALFVALFGVICLVKAVSGLFN